MKIRFSAVLFLALIVFYATSSSAAERFGVGITGGYSNDEDVSFFRTNLKISPEWRWFEEGDWYVDLHFDVGFFFLNTDSDVVNVTGAPDSLEGIALTPVWRLQRKPYSSTISPFLQAAVGVSFFSEDTLQNNEPIGLDFGSSFQFEDIIALGMQFGNRQQYEVSANYFHYSNLDIEQPNDGIDIFSATFVYYF